MASAISALANATAVFDVAGTGVVTDPDTGNVSPAAATVSVELFLKAETVTMLRYPGIDQITTVFDGYAVNPTALDSRIVVGTAGSLSFAGGVPVPFTVKELRLPYGKTGLIGEVLNATLGERIRLVSEAQAQ